MLALQWFRYCVIVFGLLVAPSAHAATTETPLTLTGARIVTAEEVQELLRGGAVLVDTRVGNEYAEAHIKGAINVPYKEGSRKASDFDPTKDRFDFAKLPRDKTKPIVYYCNSGDCWKSYKASAVSVTAGYTRVYWFRGGLPEWKKKRLPVE